MSEKNAELIKTYYTELSKIAPSQDWERILKTAKKSKRHLLKKHFCCCDKFGLSILIYYSKRLVLSR